MRKLLSVINILLILLSSVSCSSGKPVYIGTSSADATAPPPEFTYNYVDDAPLENQNAANSAYWYYNGYIYCHVFQEGFFRINPKTGLQTSLCVDPLCQGGDVCPLYTISPIFYVYENVLYFEKTTHEITQSGLVQSAYIMSYDLSTGKLTELYDKSNCSAKVVRMLLYDGYLYFYATHYTQDKTSPDEQTLIADIKAINLKSGNVITVLEYEDSIYDYFIGGYMGEIYLTDPAMGIFKIKSGTQNAGKQYIYTFDGNERWDFNNAAMKDNDIFFYTVKNDISTIYRLTAAAGKPEAVCVVDGAISKCYYTDNYIYYDIITPNIIGKLHDRDLDIMRHNISRVNYNGGDPETVWSSFPEGMETYTIVSAFSFLVVGDYIYCHVESWGKLKDEYNDADRKYDDGYNFALFRICISSRECSFICAE